MDIDESFTELNVSEEILKAIREMGFSQPSEVQAVVIPIALGNQDIIVQAQTGTGKTAAFAIPIVEKIDVNRRNIQALVLAPTRELAIQISEEIGRVGKFKRIRSLAVYGGQPVDIQKAMLKQRVHVVVATPGRLLDHIERGHIDLGQIQMLVLDEADRMLDMGLVEEVRSVLKVIPCARQTMMFSATITKAVNELADVFMISPQRVMTAPEQLAAETVEQYYWIVEEHDKISYLNSIFADDTFGSILVFCRTRATVADVTQTIKTAGFQVRGVQGNLPQEKRLEAIRSFKRGEYRYLIATDVAARGLDIDAIPLVINFDIPLDTESYIHRIGRTGRAGNRGIAITFVTETELNILQKIEDFIGSNICKINSLAELDCISRNGDSKQNTYARRVDSDETNGGNRPSEITRLYIGAGRKQKIRPTDIVGAMTGAAGVPGEAVGVIEIYDTYSFVDILYGYGSDVLERMKHHTLKGKRVKVERAQ
jgi:ATP-dependent RNA helicase DeaD